MNRRTLIAWWPILFLVTLATFVWVATALTGHTGGPAR
jgi:hypothetical protein